MLHWLLKMVKDALNNHKREDQFSPLEVKLKMQFDIKSN